MAYRKEEIKAGLVVMTALLIFGAMVVFVGGSTFWKKLKVYRIEFSAIGGLEKGASVRLGGFRIGQVQAIAVAQDDVSKLEVTIGVKHEAPIYQDILASVDTLGLVGDYYVLLTQKPGASEPLPPGSVIASRDLVEMGDLLVQAAELSKTLNSSVEQVMRSVNQILSEENIVAVRTALQGLSQISVEGQKSITAIADNLRRVLTSVDTLVVNVDGLVSENRNHVEGTLLAIKKTAERLDELSHTMNQTITENRADLRSSIATIKDDTEKAGHLIDNLDGRVTVTGDYLEETLINLIEISENLKLLSSQLRRQPWRLIYRGTGTRP